MVVDAADIHKPRLQEQLRSLVQINTELGRILGGQLCKTAVVELNSTPHYATFQTCIYNGMSQIVDRTKVNHSSEQPADH